MGTSGIPYSWLNGAKCTELIFTVARCADALSVVCARELLHQQWYTQQIRFFVSLKDGHNFAYLIVLVVLRTHVHCQTPELKSLVCEPNAPL